MKRYNFFRRLMFAVCFCAASLVAVGCYAYCLCTVALFIADRSEGLMSPATERTQTHGKIRPAPPQSEPVLYSPATEVYADAHLIAMINPTPAISTGALNGD